MFGQELWLVGRFVNFGGLAFVVRVFLFLWNKANVLRSWVLVLVLFSELNYLVPVLHLIGNGINTQFETLKSVKK